MQNGLVKNLVSSRVEFTQSIIDQTVNWISNTQITKLDFKGGNKWQTYRMNISRKHYNRNSMNEFLFSSASSDFHAFKLLKICNNFTHILESGLRDYSKLILINTWERVKSALFLRFLHFNEAYYNHLSLDLHGRKSFTAQSWLLFHYIESVFPTPRITVMRHKGLN